MEPQTCERFTLTSCVQVGLPSGISIYVNVREVEDDNGDMKRFFHLKKDKIAKLLTCVAKDELIFNKKRPLTHSDLVEQLTSARDRTFDELAHINTSDGQRTRYSQKDIRVKVASLPSMMTVNMPAMHGVNAYGIVMLASKRGSELWVELSNDNLTYLSDVVAAQIAEGTIHRKRAPRQIDGSQDGNIHTESQDAPTDSEKLCAKAGG